MRATLLKNLFTAASVVVALGLVSVAQADPLLPGGSVYAPGIGSFSTTLSGGTELASTLSAFTSSSGTLTGELGTKVFSGLNENPGGLTFVYELRTITAGSGDVGEGITNFSLFGFGSNIATDFQMGNSHYFTYNGTSVLPLEANRSADGTQIDFTFPLDISGPPIFVGQNSYQLILFTDATTYTATSATVDTNWFDSQTLGSASVSSFRAVANASAVPDGATTASLLGLSFVVLAGLSRRSKRA